MSGVAKVGKGGSVTFTTRAAPNATRFFVQATTDDKGMSLPVSMIYHVELCGLPDNALNVAAYAVSSFDLWQGGALVTIRNEGTWTAEVWTDYT